MPATAITDCGSSLPQLRLLQLISPTLPIGSFTYSQGIEWAVEAGWVNSRNDLLQWMQEQVRSTLTTVDLPILLRFHDASLQLDLDAMHYWSDYLIACRETAELRTEEANRGRAFSRLLQSLGLTTDPEWLAVMNRCQSAGFAHAAQTWGISRQDMLGGFAWSWLENLVLAGVKIIPLGQTDGQKILHELSPALVDAISTALHVQDGDIGESNPALAIASSQHQFQYTRLFRS